MLTISGFSNSADRAETGNLPWSAGITRGGCGGRTRSPQGNCDLRRIAERVSHENRKGAEWRLFLVLHVRTKGDYDYPLPSFFVSLTLATLTSNSPLMFSISFTSVCRAYITLYRFNKP